MKPGDSTISFPPVNRFVLGSRVSVASACTWVVSVCEAGLADSGVYRSGARCYVCERFAAH